MPQGVFLFKTFLHAGKATL